MPTLALLHTTSVTVPTLSELAKEHVPGARVINVVDDGLLSEVIAAGRVTEAVEARIGAYVRQAAAAGADAVMCCCSSVGEVIDRAARGSRIPLWRIDEAMAEEAVSRRGRIGIAATLPTTLAPTSRLVRRKADEAGRAVEIVEALVEGAFAALQAGRNDEHDAKVLAALESLVARVDVVVLAQASMARLLSKLSTKVPVLTSPVSGLKRAAERLGQR